MRWLFTKRLGTGVIATALKRGMARDADVTASIASMLTLNRQACEAMLQYDVHGCTDVTGFGLIGHAREMALASGVTLEIEVDRLRFLDGALEYARLGAIPGGLKNNREYAACAVETARDVAPELEDLLYDPQTSGGLLITLPDADAAALVSAFPDAYRDRARAAAAGETYQADMTQNRIIVALDVDSAAEARALVARLGDRIGFYKVGMELYAAAGMDFVRELLDQGKDVFLDQKYYDIGETVKRAVRVAARSGVRFLTVHGSSQVMRAAIEGRGDAATKLLAVTVLTSFDQQDLADMGYACAISSLVSLRVRKAMEAGMDGLVCSPLDAAAVRAQAGPRAILVTPGVRSGGAAKGDQKRVATPAEAMRDGADYVVMGRQITRAADPAAEAARVAEELAAWSVPTA